MNYKILGTGSRGNCVIINDVMVDCGLGFNKIKHELYDINYLLITHVHQDHLLLPTIRKITERFPTITIIGNYEVYQAFNVNIIANEGFEIITDDYTFTPFKCIHDVYTYGYTWSYQGQEIIYATDTATLEYAPLKKYDYLFLESNHDESKLEAIRGKQAAGSYDPYLSGKRHLSTQQAKAFYYMNRRTPESELIELHQSTRFY